MKVFRGAILAGIALLAGCNSRTYVDDNPVKGAVSFAQINDVILKPNCLICHGGSQTPQLTEYARVIANLGAIDRVVLVDKTMPKRGPLAPGEQDLLRRWIATGAPELGDATPPPMESARPNVTWAQLQSEVIRPKCAACHFAGNPDKISDLEDEETLRSLIGPLLFLSVVRNTMPPAPAGTAEEVPNPNQLSRAEKETLSHWVIDGMLE